MDYHFPIVDRLFNINSSIIKECHVIFVVCIIIVLTNTKGKSEKKEETAEKLRTGSII